jgi:hypothetical protein
MLSSWVSSWCYQQMLDKAGKFLPGANTIAYLASSLAAKKKSFITLTPGIFLSLVLYYRVYIDNLQSGEPLMPAPRVSANFRLT